MILDDNIDEFLERFTLVLSNEENATIGDGETLNATIPQSGVITVYAIDGGSSNPVPTVSEWGLLVMTLIMLATGSVVLRRGIESSPL